MNKTDTKHWLQSDALLLMKASDINREIGKNLHIMIRRAIPSSIELYEIEKKHWEPVRSEIEQNHGWADEHKIDITELDHVDEESHFQCLHLESGITLCWKSFSDSVTIYYDHKSDRQVLEDLKHIIGDACRKPSGSVIGYLMMQRGNLCVRQQEFRPYEDDLIRFLGEEACRFRDRMIEQLRKKHHSGLYLLHGKPGTGKTSFIKSVITQVDKPVIFLTPAMTDSLTSPALIGVLMDNPETILIIEDAETVLMKRQGDNSNAVANLLNLTDGFPADFLNLNIICTFNSSLDDIDPALLRKGRLKGIHQFQMLQPEQVAELAKHLDVEADATKPMSLAEVCHGKSETNQYFNESIGFITKPNGNL
jgi:hypothetical protein